MTTTSSKFYGHGQPPKGPNGLPVDHPSNFPPAGPAEDRFLGRASEYSDQYDPTLLQPLPRQDNRNDIDINPTKLPFIGCDVWNAYEVSCLAANGVPVAAIAKISYPSDSVNIVESKSLKLYLNSFNMTKFGVAGETAAAIREQMQEKIGMDLSAILYCNVECHVFDPDDATAHTTPWRSATSEHLEKEVDITKFNEADLKYNEDPELLDIVNQIDIVEQLSHSNLLRSNCKVTHQPDWGSVVIAYKGPKFVTSESLMKYIISFRNENHFHEEICETIFKRLLDKLEPEDLCVACFYTRRGGIDINPIRSINEDYIGKVIRDYDNMSILSPKYPRQ